MRLSAGITAFRFRALQVYVFARSSNFSRDHDVITMVGAVPLKLKIAGLGLSA